MQDLTGSYQIPLVPTSQECGNMAFSNKLAMTAPGSVPVTPLPSYMDEPYGVPQPGLPQPQPPATKIPVSTQDQPRQTWTPGGGRWADVDNVRDPGQEAISGPSGEPPSPGGWTRV